MVELGKTLDVATAAEWRDWLDRHHRIESEIWSAILSGWPSVTDSDVKMCRLISAILTPLTD